MNFSIISLTKTRTPTQVRNTVHVSQRKVICTRGVVDPTDVWDTAQVSNSSHLDVLSSRMKK